MELFDEVQNESMNDVKLFSSEKFGAVRTVKISDDIWFVAKDVAIALGYTNPNEAIAEHIEDDDKLDSKTLLTFDYKKLGQRGGWLINESGLYSLVLSSKLDSAKEFKHWITSEVIPSIRKNGGYIRGQEKMSNEQILASALILANNIISQKDKVIAEQTPKVQVYNRIADSSGLKSVEEVGSILGYGKNNFFRKLRELKIFKYITNEQGRINLPYQEYIDRGYFETKEEPYGESKQFSYTRIFVTPKGELWLSNQVA